MAVDFKAMLAAKRAEKEAAALAAGTQATSAPTAAPVSEVKTIPEPVKEAPVVSTEPVKKKTFAEIMAEKKAAASPNSVAPTQSSQTVVAQESTGTAPSSIVQSVPETAGVEEPGTDLSTRLREHDAAVDVRMKQMEEDIANGTVDPQTAQAYADIKAKIELLEGMEDTNLSGAMSELKKALMANPNAVSLMHDTDIGKMVIALRRITKEAQIEAVKEKTTGKKGSGKAKQLTLSADELAKVWDEI